MVSINEAGALAWILALFVLATLVLVFGLLVLPLAGCLAGCGYVIGRQAERSAGPK